MSEMVERVVRAMEERARQEPCTIEDVARAVIDVIAAPAAADGDEAALHGRLSACEDELASVNETWRAALRDLREMAMDEKSKTIERRCFDLILYGADAVARALQRVEIT